MAQVFDYPDTEVLALELFDPIGTVATFVPDDYEQILLSGEPVLLVERVGGLDDGVTDRAEILVSCWGIDRPTAWEAARKAKRLVEQYTYGGAVGPFWVDTTAVTQTATQIAVEDPDERRVLQSFRIDTRRQNLEE